MKPAPETRAQLLAVASQLVQTRGFNAFSYRDLSEAVGIKTASIHYHFPTKQDLGVQLLEDYLAATQKVLASIEASDTPALDKYRSFVAIFSTTARSKTRLCLAGMLATDLGTLPEVMCAEIRRFFRTVEAWLAALLARGQSAGEFRFTPSALALARTIVSSLEGGLVSARVFESPERVTSIGTQLEALFVPQ